MNNSSSYSLPPPPPPPSSSILNNIQSKISPSILLIIAILAIIFFICGLLHLLVRYLLKMRRRGRDDADSVTAFQGQLQQLFHLHDAGVDQMFIDALPVFLYRAIVGADKDPFDCAVCLCEFEPDDKLRLLPKCSHAFHLECIDTWLLSHSTCPLCRRSLLSELSPTCSPVVLILESESSREIGASGRSAHGHVGLLGDDEPRANGNDSAQKAEEVVEVKLGKFKCVDVNANATEGEGTSSNANANAKASLGQRRCLSMGSYEYVMDDRAPLHVAVKPPKKKPASSKSRRRLAMSECDFGHSKREVFRVPSGTASREATSAGKHCYDNAAARLNKDSFSVSKIWLVSSKKDDGMVPAASERRTVSFRWPAHQPGMAEECNKQSGSEVDWDVEAGSCSNSIVSSLAEERPSFARRTLLWVVGGRQQSRVGNHS